MIDVPITENEPPSWHGIKSFTLPRTSLPIKTITSSSVRKERPSYKYHDMSCKWEVTSHGGYLNANFTIADNTSMNKIVGSITINDILKNMARYTTIEHCVIKNSITVGTFLLEIRTWLLRTSPYKVSLKAKRHYQSESNFYGIREFYRVMLVAHLALHR